MTNRGRRWLRCVTSVTRWLTAAYRRGVSTAILRCGDEASERDAVRLCRRRHKTRELRTGGAVVWQVVWQVVWRGGGVAGEAEGHGGVR